MAGDGWVWDIIWHTMMLLGNALADLWSSWSMEILLGVSFITQLVLTFFAGFRWRGASDPLRRVIWLFYVGADYVATTALGHLSVSGTSGERRLVAFWAPFFLLHLGGPDSITAYQLEDNQLSARYVLELVLRVAGALYIVYKSISGTGSWALVPAAWLMLLVGVAKYVEKTLALHRANLANVRSSLETQQRRRAEGARRRRPPKPKRAIFHGADDDGDLIMRAHYLFHICKHAIVDSSVETMESDGTTDDDGARTKEILFQLEWQKLCKVMEMELSLMYDFLYTKAAVIHTWHGYCIRALSPLVTAAALLLVEFSNQAAGRRHRQSDVVITRALLVATFLLETASLLRALGSSWTGFLLHYRLPQGWLRHEAFCASRWSQFHRSVASLGRLAKVQAHRSWSGNMGQLNMLQFITREQPGKEQEFGGNVVERYAETKNLVIPPDVKELVIRRLMEKVLKFRDGLKRDVGDTGGAALEFVKMAAQYRTKRGQDVLEGYDLLDLEWSLGDELQLGILIWHIGTDVYLLKSGKSKAEQGSRVARYVEAITTLSNYMMYLLAVRPDMLPGLVTRKLFELTCEELTRFWSKHGAVPTDLQPSSSSFCNVIRRLFKLNSDRRISGSLKQENLAEILYDDWDSGAAVNPYLFNGLRLAHKLIRRERSGKVKVDMLQLILEVWVDMLFYAGYRCSSESHAKQLSHGGELTTIAWLLAEHVGLFVARKTSRVELKARRKGNMNAV